MTVAVRHLWAAVWWADSCWHVAPTAHREIEGAGLTIQEALADLERMIDRLEPVERRRLRDGTTSMSLPRSHLIARVAVVDE